MSVWEGQESRIAPAHGQCRDKAISLWDFGSLQHRESQVSVA